MLSNYVLLKADKNKVLLNAVKGVEDEYKIADTQREKNKALYLMAYMLSGQKLMYIQGRTFRTVGELADYLKELLDESYDRFEALCHELIDYDDHLDAQLECWLLALGKRQELTKWKNSLKESGDEVKR